MVDYIELGIEIIVLGLSASYYHLIYWALETLKQEINDWYFILRHPVTLMTYLLIAVYINENGSGLRGIMDVLMFYSLVVYTIMEMGYDSRFLFLGVSSAFFLSEYWEIPIYLWQIATGYYSGVNVIQTSYLLGRFMLKFLTLIYVVDCLNELGLDFNKFIDDMIEFSIVYIPFVFAFFYIFDGSKIWGISFNWFFRISCFFMMLKYLYTQGVMSFRGKYHGESSN